MMNSALINGRLGRDPVWKSFEGGNGVLNFSVACPEKYVDKSGEQKEKTEWINIVVWGKAGEAAKDQIKKGSEVFIFGKVSTRKYTDKAGVEKYATEVIAQRVFVGIAGAPSQGQTAGPPAASTPAGGTTPYTENDIPF